MLPIQGTAASSREHNGCVTLAFTWQWRAYDADQALAPRAWSASIPIKSGWVPTKSYLLPGASLILSLTNL